MDKESAKNILEDVEYQLKTENWKENTLKAINQYEKVLKIATNKKIKKLTDKQKEYIRRYGENGRKTIKLNKKIDDELRKTFNS